MLFDQAWIMLPQCDTAVERSEKKKVFPFATEIISRIRLKSLAICTFATTTVGASSSFRLLTLFFAHFLEGFRTILVISSAVFFQKTLHATSINILFLWFYSLKGKLNISCPLFGEFCPLWWCGCSFSKAQQDGMLGKKLMRKKLCLVCLCNSQAMFPHLKLL